MEIAKWISFSWVEFVELVRLPRSLGEHSLRINLFRRERLLRTNECRKWSGGRAHHIRGLQDLYGASVSREFVLR